jgi:hypothetical protein
LQPSHAGPCPACSFCILYLGVKYRFPIGIRRRSEIRLRDKVRISKTKWLRCRGKVSESEWNTEPIYWKGKAWLQLVHCALLYAWCPILERDLEEDGSPRGRV